MNPEQERAIIAYTTGILRARDEYDRTVAALDAQEMIDKNLCMVCKKRPRARKARRCGRCIYAKIPVPEEPKVLKRPCPVCRVRECNGPKASKCLPCGRASRPDKPMP